MKNKKIVFIFVLTLFSLSFLKSQSFSWGARGGLLYDFGGELSLRQEINGIKKNIFEDKGRVKTGWQAGVFARAEIPFLFAQPELVYSRSSYDYVTQGKSNFNSVSQKLDFSILFGPHFLEFFRAYIAPVVSFNFRNKIDLKGITISSADRWGIGFQIGLGVDIFNITVDIKWVRGLGGFENIFEGDAKKPHYVINNKPSTLIFSLGFRF